MEAAIWKQRAVTLIPHMRIGTVKDVAANQSLHQKLRIICGHWKCLQDRRDNVHMLISLAVQYRPDGSCILSICICTLVKWDQEL